MSSMSDALGVLDKAVDVLVGADSDVLTVRERLAALGRLESVVRRVRARADALAVGCCRDGDAVDAKVIADVVRVSPAEVRRRLRDAELVESRVSLTGEVLAPVLAGTAVAWHAGDLDPEHVRVVGKFVRELPETLHPATVESAEAFLADQAQVLRPDQLAKVADRLAVTLNPDGVFSDDYRALQRGFSWCGRQRADGMSVGKLTATPELRAMLDAWLGKFAAPGMGNPDDQTPVTGGEPDPAAVDGDRRSCAQRQHDALAVLVRGQLGDPTLGLHNGLPVTVIVSITLEQLCAGTGQAVTGGGSLLPMADVIRMAAHAWHYLAVFDRHTERPLYLGRTKRIATADQRIVLHAKDRGCTAPGCDMPGYLCEVHHVNEWSEGGATNIDQLTFACGPHHRLIKLGGWRTRKRPDGTTEWQPPPDLPIPGGTNTYHHPAKLIGDGWEIAGG